MTKHTPYSHVTHGGVHNTRIVCLEDATFEDLVNAHQTPVPVDVASITYHNSTKKQRGDYKKALPYFVGGTAEGKRHDTNMRSRTLLTLDVEQGDKGEDTVPPSPDIVAARLKDLGGAGWIYTSLSHTPRSPRYRVVLPLGKPITGTTEEMQAAVEASTRAAAKELGIDAWTRPESWVLSQPMYLPAKLKGGTFYQDHCDGKSWSVVRKNVPDKPRVTAADIPDERPDEVLHAIKAAGLYLRENPRHKGMHFITCPFADQHGAENDTQTVYYEAHFDGNPRAAVKCFDTEPDTDGIPHLTYSTLVRHLREGGHLSQEQQDKAGVLDDYDTFDAKADLSTMLDTEPVAREWAINQFAPIGKVTVLAGPGGVSKSMLMLHLLVHAAMEQPWAHFTTDFALRSLYVSYEDDMQELHKRVNTLAAALRGDGVLDALYDVNGTIRANLRMFAADDEAASWLLLTKPERFGSATRTDRVNWLIGYLKTKKIKCLCLDPAVYTHQLEENDIADMAAYMQTLTHVAKQAQCAVIVLHHMNKVSGWAALDDINQGSLRGASSFADNARSVAVVVNMPIKDAETYGLPPDPATSSRFAVVKHVKHNYSAPLPAMIFERKGALLVHRSDIQRMDMAQLADARESQRNQLADLRAATLAPKVLQVLLDHDGPISQAQIAHALSMKPVRIKAAVSWCETQELLDVERSGGSGRSTLHSITPDGKAWMKAYNRKERK